MSWILLTADVTEELALGQKLLKAEMCIRDSAYSASLVPLRF